MVQPLDDNFLQLEEARDLKFALMLVFGSPRVVLPVPPIKGFEEPNRYYELNQATARIVIDDCAIKYWPRQNYLMVNGRPYVSIFTSDLSAHGQAKKDALRQLLGEMREYSLRKYKVDPYIVGVVRKVSSGQDLVSAGAEALTGYAFLPEFGTDVPPIQVYSDLLAQRKIEWEEMKNTIGVSIVPPAVTGWDASPRGQSQCQLAEVAGCYPYTPIVVGSSPENFATMLKDTLTFVRENVPAEEQYGIVCAWNEITEGASLLPEVKEQGVDFGYLEALKKTTK